MSYFSLKNILFVFLANITICFSFLASYACDDLSLLGNPSIKIDWHEGLDDSFQGPDDPETVFEIDENEYLILSKIIHGTEVVVAVHNSFVGEKEVRGFLIPTPEEFADRVFKTFRHHFHVFGGYPYDRYTVKVKPFSESSGFSLSKVGVALSKNTDEPNPDFPPHDYVEAFDGFVQHEMFHSWLGKLIQFELDGSENLFQLETWIIEGGATYYGDRTASLVIKKSFFKKLMREKLRNYNSIIGSPLDLSVQELTDLIGQGPPGNDPTQGILYTRSAFINYLLDKELKKLGFDLDILMKRLYEDFGLTGKKWLQKDVVQILLEETGRDFSDFFDKFLHTNRTLPIKRKIKFLKHANQCSTID